MRSKRLSDNLEKRNSEWNLDNQLLFNSNDTEDGKKAAADLVPVPCQASYTLDYIDSSQIL